MKNTNKYLKYSLLSLFALALVFASFISLPDRAEAKVFIIDDGNNQTVLDFKSEEIRLSESLQKRERSLMKRNLALQNNLDARQDVNNRKNLNMDINNEIANNRFRQKIANNFNRLARNNIHRNDLKLDFIEEYRNNIRLNHKSIQDKRTEFRDKR